MSTRRQDKRLDSAQHGWFLANSYLQATTRVHEILERSTLHSLYAVKMHHTSGFLRSTLSTITMNFHALALFRRLNAGSIMTSFLGILLLQQQGHQPLINLHKIDGRISPVVTCTFPVKLTERTLRKAVTASQVQLLLEICPRVNWI
jgi:hypothetical protein